MDIQRWDDAQDRHTLYQRAEGELEARNNPGEAQAAYRAQARVRVGAELVQTASEKYLGMEAHIAASTQPGSGAEYGLRRLQLTYGLAAEALIRQYMLG
jgi:hypothetical protein